MRKLKITQRKVRLAMTLIKAQIKASGHKLSDFSNRELLLNARVMASCHSEKELRGE